MEFIKFKMLLFSTVFFMLLLIIFLSLNVSAHSPSSMSLSYDSTTNEFRVDISHQVSNPNSHYVYSIIVKINGVTNITQDYTNQPGSSFSYTYEDIDLIEGNTFEVNAFCNQGGSISKELTVSYEGISEPDENSSTPGFDFIIYIISIITFIILVKRR
jgi:hypothetical protein